MNIISVKLNGHTNKTRNQINLPKGYWEKLERLRYSESTIRIYSKYMRDFCTAFKNDDLLEIGINEINEYLHHQAQMYFIIHLFCRSQT